MCAHERSLKGLRFYNDNTADNTATDSWVMSNKYPRNINQTQLFSYDVEDLTTKHTYISTTTIQKMMLRAKRNNSEIDISNQNSAHDLVRGSCSYRQFQARFAVVWKCWYYATGNCRIHFEACWFDQCTADSEIPRGSTSPYIVAYARENVLVSVCFEQTRPDFPLCACVCAVVSSEFTNCWGADRARR